MNRNPSLWREILVGIVVGIVLLAGQFVIQPMIAERSLEKQTKWLEKYTAYSESMFLLNKHFSYLPWTGPTIPQQYDIRQLSEKEKELFEDEIRKVYSKVVLLSPDTTISSRFISFFEDLETYRDSPTTYLRDYVNLLRNDVGLDALPDSFVFKYVVGISY